MGIMNMGHTQDEDQLLKDLFKQSSSVPDETLREKILEKVTIKKEAVEYEPVISRKAWIMILSGLSGLMVFLFSFNQSESFRDIGSGWFSNRVDWQFPTGFLDRWLEFSLPQLSLPIAGSMIILIIFGLYFMLSFKWFRKYFS